MHDECVQQASRRSAICKLFPASQPASQRGLHVRAYVCVIAFNPSHSSCHNDGLVPFLHSAVLYTCTDHRSSKHRQIQSVSQSVSKSLSSQSVSQSVSQSIGSRQFVLSSLPASLFSISINQASSRKLSYSHTLSIA